MSDAQDLLGNTAKIENTGNFSITTNKDDENLTKQRYSKDEETYKKNQKAKTGGPEGRDTGRLNDVTKTDQRTKKVKKKVPKGSSNAGDRLDKQAEKDSAKSAGPVETEPKKDQDIAGAGGNGKSTTDNIIDRKDSPAPTIDQILGGQVKPATNPTPSPTPSPEPLLSGPTTDVKPGTGFAGTPGSISTGGFNEAGFQKGAAMVSALMQDLGLTDYQAAGLAGNIWAESGWQPDIIQGGGHGKLTDVLNVKSVGYSYAQWTTTGPNGRKQDFYNYAKALYNSDPQKYPNPDTQNINDEVAYKYLVYDLKTNYPDVLKNLQNASSLRAASNVILNQFEAPRARPEATRAGYGQHIFDIYNKAQ